MTASVRAQTLATFEHTLVEKRVKSQLLTFFSELLKNMVLFCIVITVSSTSSFPAHGKTWTPKNKRPERLRDQLKELEVR